MMNSASETVTLVARVAELEAANAALRRTITIHERQLQHISRDDEVRRLRAKLAEWEGSSQLMNGRYYHGSRVIRPYVDREEE